MEAEVLPIAALGAEAEVEAAEPALSRTQANDAPRGSQCRRQHHQVRRSGRDPYPNGRASNRKGEVPQRQITARESPQRHHQSSRRSLA